MFCFMWRALGQVAFAAAFTRTTVNDARCLLVAVHPADYAIIRRVDCNPSTFESGNAPFESGNAPFESDKPQ